MGKNKRSKYTGLSWNIQKQKWEVYQTKNGISIHGGLHETELEAARASDRLAIELGITGEVRLNFPQEVKSIKVKTEVRIPCKRKGGSVSQHSAKRQRIEKPETEEEKESSS